MEGVYGWRRIESSARNNRLLDRRARRKSSTQERFCQWAEEHPEATLEQAPERPDWLHGNRRRTFEKALLKGLSLREEDWPAPPRKEGERRLSREEETLLRQILDARDDIAAGLNLEPGILASRDALRMLVRHRPRTEEELRANAPLMSWQIDCLCETILPLLQADSCPSLASECITE